MSRDPAGGSEPTSCGVALADAGALLDALRDLSSETRLAVVRALSALSLERDAWLALQPYALAALADRSLPEHLDVIDVAARVPLRSVRVDLVRLAEGGEPEERRRATFALARAHDQQAIEPLMRLLDEPATEGAAARHLALIDVTPSADALAERWAALAKGPGSDWTCFWLALALARSGRDDALDPSLERLRAERAEIDLRWGEEATWGDPDLLLAELRQGPPLSDSVLARLRRRREPSLLADLLLRASEPLRSGGPITTGAMTVEPLKAAPLEREHVREAIERSPIRRQLDTDVDAVRDTFEELVDRLAADSDRTRAFSLAVSELFRLANPGRLGPANIVVDLIARAGASYVPDGEGLLDAHRRAVQAGGVTLRAQIAWASSRRGLGFLLRALAHRLPKDALAVAQLVRDAADYERASEPPIFFAGPADLPVPSAPPELIEDLVAANGGGEHAEPPTRGLPAHEAPPEAIQPAARPSRGLPQDGETEPTAGEPPEAEPVQPPQPGPATAQSRSIQAQVFDLHDLAQPQLVDRAFRAGTPHQVAVRVGPSEAGWLAPASGASFDEALGPVEGAQPLTVIFLVGAAALPQQAVILLPPSGPSTACTFSFQTEADGGSLEAQIHVFHRNRLVQLALLHGPVCTDPTAPPMGALIELGLAVIVPSTMNLADRKPFDAAVARTGARTGAGATAGVADDELVVFDNDRIERSTPALTRTLRDLATSEAARRRDLSDESSVAHLRDLAFQGRELYDVIGEPIAERLSGPGKALERIQVLVESAADFFPVELVYDLPPPTDDATLCPGWKTALRTGRCPNEHEAQGVRRLCPTVCPSGFWSISKVIERQVLSDESWASAELRGAEFAVRAAVSGNRSTLAAPSVVLFAASDRVDQVKPGQIELVRKALERSAPGSGFASTWEDWVQGVERLSPTLLVLLSHTTEVGASPALEIGAEQRCRISQLLPEYVRSSADLHPIVLLLGCETAVSDFGLQTFVARFQDLGAGLVVGTIASVLGQRAAAVAREITAELNRAAGRRTPVRAGELLRDVRRRLLAKGELTALCLTAFGDADWQLGGN